MTSATMPWKVRSALLAILTDDFVVKTCNRLISRRNVVLHITGNFTSTKGSLDIVAKWFQQPGIANEIQVLRDAFLRRIAVPCTIGSTSHVLLLRHKKGNNLCDLITENPSPRYGVLLGEWLAKYHEAFQRDDSPSRVLLKGDARIRNFIHDGTQIFGVDFEECVTGHYLKDLASTCASILDTDPLFTREKFMICRSLLEKYSDIREMRSLTHIVKDISPHILQALETTAVRRGNPPKLIKCINQFKAEHLF